MKKTINEKRICASLVLCLSMIIMATVPCFAANDPVGFSGIVSPIVDLINSLLKPIMAIVGAVGSLYCVMLGVRYAKAEEPQDREKAKAHLKSAIIGFLLIFILIALLNMLMEPMMKWASTVRAAK